MIQTIIHPDLHLVTVSNGPASSTYCFQWVIICRDWCPIIVTSARQHTATVSNPVIICCGVTGSFDPTMACSCSIGVLTQLGRADKEDMWQVASSIHTATTLTSIAISYVTPSNLCITSRLQPHRMHTTAAWQVKRQNCEITQLSASQVAGFTPNLCISVLVWHLIVMYVQLSVKGGIYHGRTAANHTYTLHHIYMITSRLHHYGAGSRATPDKDCTSLHGAWDTNMIHHHGLTGSMIQTWSIVV